MEHRHHTLVAAWRFHSQSKLTLESDMLLDGCDEHFPNHLGVFGAYFGE